MWKHFSLSFLLSNLIGQLKQGMNERRTKMFGHSFKICSKILVHLIHLSGKMIHYGTNIYIYVRTPNSNKNFFWNYTPPIRGHSGFWKTYHKIKKVFFRITLNMIFIIFWHIVWFTNKIKLRQLRPQVF